MKEIKKASDLIDAIGPKEGDTVGKINIEKPVEPLPGSFESVIIPMIRRVNPSTLADDISSSDMGAGVEMLDRVIQMFNDAGYKVVLAEEQDYHTKH